MKNTAKIDTDPQGAIFDFTSIYMPAPEASAHWKLIIKHHNELTKILQREVALITSISDYFTFKYPILQDPRIISSFRLNSLFYKASHDHSIGFLRKEFFIDLLEIQIEYANIYQQVFSLLFFDIDKFKVINSNFGHIIGDKIIYIISKIIINSTQTECSLGRFGGDEFMIALPNGQQKDAELLKQTIQFNINNHNYDFLDANTSITISGGISYYPHDSSSAVELIKIAESRMLKDKLS